MKIYSLLNSLAAGLALTTVLGCNDRPAGSPRTNAVTRSDSEDEDHTHGAGPHGGTVADWGGGKYHVEFCVNHQKKEATVYLLKADAKTAAPIQTDKLLLSIKEPAFQIELKAVPQEGDGKGCSRFAGTHDRLGKEQEFAGTISGEINGKPYAADFQEEPEGHTGKPKDK